MQRHPFRPLSLAVAPLALGLVPFAGGCGKDSREPTILQARGQPYVADIPVPAKFTLNETKSTYSFTAGRRNVKHLYEGKASGLLVRNFYVHNMPPAGWVLTNDSLDNSVYTIKFRKAEERCEVRVERTPSGLGYVTQIWATVRSDVPELPKYPGPGTSYDENRP